MQEGGFLTIDTDHSLHLTETGQEATGKIYERHCFLTDLLVGMGVSKETAEKDAGRIEHVISEESFQKLKEVHKNQVI